MEISEGQEGNMDDCYLDYLTDPKGTIELEGVRFYKVIFKTEFTGLKTKSNPGGRILLLRVDKAVGGKVGDFYIDEKGMRMRLDSTEMIHISGEFPDWYWNTIGLAFYGQNLSDIGEYLALAR